ncbi:MAG TPA: hypothetical protein VE996_01540 [Terriglobales bacterium]|nr:hypothetical protein [Terriglobales bacterium]
MQYRWGLAKAACAVALVIGYASCGGSPGSSSSAAGDPLVNTAAAPGARIFPNAAWLYRAPSGPSVDIGYLHATLSINDHRGGFDFPVQSADGGNGWVHFTDGYGGSENVPVPDGGFAPSVGGWGADDGHLVVIDRSNNRFYDFWKLTVDGSGRPTSTRVGQIVSGPLDGNGNPGTTAADISGAAGDLMPGEIQNGIDHALSCIVPGAWNNSSLGDQAPAAKTDGSSNGPLSEGGKIGVDPNLNVDSLDVGSTTKAILKAFQRYGCAITDQNSSSNVIGIYSALPNLDNLDRRGMDQVGRYLRFYF